MAADDLDPVARDDDLPTMPTWAPEWRVDVGGGGCEVGVAIDDGCFVALVQDEFGYWTPTSHVPTEAARLMGDLALFAGG